MSASGLVLAQKASEGVHSAAGPLFALAVALLLLSLGVVVVWFIISRMPRE